MTKNGGQIWKLSLYVHAGKNMERHESITIMQCWWERQLEHGSKRFKSIPATPTLLARWVGVTRERQEEYQSCRTFGSPGLMHLHGTAFLVFRGTSTSSPKEIVVGIVLQAITVEKSE
jgi:hypothetical protein